MIDSSLAGYICEYSNSEGSNNDATNRCAGIAVVSEDDFLLSINRDDQGYYAICKWTDCTYSTGRGNDVLQWFYNFDTVNLENPFGMAVDGFGYVYVCNNDPNHNILVFDGNLPDPLATPYRLETTTDDTICAIDIDDLGYVYVCYCNAEEDRVDIYPPINSETWTDHTGSPDLSIYLPDGIYYGLCVNRAGTDVYVSEYISSIVHRYSGSVAQGFNLDTGFSVPVDSLVTAIDIGDQDFLYLISDHWRQKTYDYSWFWVVDLTHGVVTDKVDMYMAGGGNIYGASETSAGYYSAVDLEVDDAGNIYVLHDYAWAVEKWAGSPSTGVELTDVTSRMPTKSVLVQNYPNPFNASTEIRYQLPADSHVKLDVFNVAGQLVDSLVDGERPAGQHAVVWDASDLASGIYLVRLQAGETLATSKMALVR
jgi:hypothetical protein